MTDTGRLPHAPRAVVFDMDGLLLDSETIYRAAHMQASTDAGFTMTDALHISLVGRPAEAAERLLTEAFGPTLDLAQYNARCAHHFEALAAGVIPLRPGVVELLDFLDERALPRAVATSTDRVRALRHLEHAGILARFDAVVTRTDVTRGKPAPDTFLEAAARLGVAPARCVALEDSHNGVRAAAASRMMTVMVPNLLPPTDEMRTLCAMVCASLHDVRDEIARLHA